MGNQVGKVIQSTKENIHNRTNFGGTRFRQEDENGSRCVELCDKGSIVDEM